MMELFLADEVFVDLAEISDFIAQDNLDASERLELEFHRAMHALARKPFLGHRRSDVTSKDYWFFTVRSLPHRVPENAPTGNSPNSPRRPRSYTPPLLTHGA